MQNRAASASMFDILPEMGKSMSISIPGDSFSGEIIPNAIITEEEDADGAPQFFPVPEWLRGHKLMLLSAARERVTVRRRTVSRLANSTALCIAVAMMTAFLIVWSALMQYAAHLAG